MNGQMKKSKNEIVEEYIRNVNPYEKPEPLDFDMRGYAAYVAEQGLIRDEITPEILQMFSSVKTKQEH